MPAADPPYFFLVARAASVLRQASDAATLSAAGVTAAQAGALFAIAAGQAPSQRQLGVTLGLGDAAVTGLVNRLERLGLVRREVDPADGRARRLTLSDQGRAALEAIEPARRRLNIRIAEVLGDDAERVASALARLARLSDDAAVPPAPGGAGGA